MKNHFCLLALLLCIFACAQPSQNAANDAAKAAIAAQPGMPGRLTYVVQQLKFHNLGAVVPNPVETMYTFTFTAADAASVDYAQMQKEKKLAEASFSISTEQAAYAQRLIQSITRHPDGTVIQSDKPCLGQQGREYFVTWAEQKKTQFTVAGNASCTLNALLPGATTLDSFVNVLVAQYSTSTTAPTAVTDAAGLLKKLQGTWVSETEKGLSMTIKGQNITQNKDGKFAGKLKLKVLNSLADSECGKGLPANRDMKSLGLIQMEAQDFICYQVVSIEPTLVLQQLDANGNPERYSRKQ